MGPSRTSRPGAHTTNGLGARWHAPPSPPTHGLSVTSQRFSCSSASLEWPHGAFTTNAGVIVALWVHGENLTSLARRPDPGQATSLTEAASANARSFLRLWCSI